MVALVPFRFASVMVTAGYSLPAVWPVCPAGQPAREWTVVFDSEAQRSDPAAREHAREKLAEAVAAESA